MIRRGDLDGTIISDQLALSFALSNHIKTVTHIPGGLHGHSMYLVVNKEKWALISPKDQAAIRAISGITLSQKLGELSQHGDLKSREFLQAKLGENYVVASSEFLLDLEWALLDEEEQWVLKANHLGVDGQAAVEMFKSLRTNTTGTPPVKGYLSRSKSFGWGRNVNHPLRSR